MVSYGKYFTKWIFGSSLLAILKIRYVLHLLGLWNATRRLENRWVLWDLFRTSQLSWKSVFTTKWDAFSESSGSIVCIFISKLLVENRIDLKLQNFLGFQKLRSVELWRSGSKGNKKPHVNQNVSIQSILWSTIHVCKACWPMHWELAWQLKGYDQIEVRLGFWSTSSW